jgi:hypothetical protein
VASFYSLQKELLESDDPAKLKKELAVKSRGKLANPYAADEERYIMRDDPALTRRKLAFAFQAWRITCKHSSKNAGTFLL